MSTRSELYRKRAQQFERLASIIDDRITKGRLLELAMDGRWMAMEAERFQTPPAKTINPSTKGSDRRSGEAA